MRIEIGNCWVIAIAHPSAFQFARVGMLVSAVDSLKPGTLKCVSCRFPVSSGAISISSVLNNSNGHGRFSTLGVAGIGVGRGRGLAADIIDIPDAFQLLEDPAELLDTVHFECHQDRDRPVVVDVGQDR